MIIPSFYSCFLAFLLIAHLLIVATTIRSPIEDENTRHKHRIYHKQKQHRTLTVSGERDNRDFYDPTPIELQQGIAFAAPKYWGVHVRQSKSLRIAFLGGSQTVAGWHVNSFIEPMTTASKKMG